MGLQTSKSRFALVKETTEGTPVSPTAGTQYINLQEGFEITPEFEELENAEFTSSIGRGKSILGLENPTGSLNHYLRHSGVEGQAPNYGLLLELLMGATATAGSEFDTVGGSTAGTASAAAVIEVDAGEGASYERGEALLIKDTANGFSIRPIDSISGDSLTLGFNLGAAPAAGVNLGQAVLYKPGADHDTLTAWDYRANGGAVQMLSGGRVTEGSFEFAAGQLINGSFSIEGIKFFYNPIEITSTTNKIDFNDGGGEENVSVAAQFYKDPHELADAIAAAMNEATGDTITVSYSDTTGEYTISTSGGTLSLLWNGGSNAGETIAGKIGFDNAADDTGSTSYTADNPIDLESPQTPSTDDEDPLVAKANELFIGGFADTGCVSASSVTVAITNERQPKNDICADSGRSGSRISRREATVEVQAYLEQYQADYFRRFRTNQETKLLYNFGAKSAGDWIAGRSGCVYLPTATIVNHSLTDDGGLVILEMTLRAYVDDGNGEVYMNFV